jgi:hypothetical protein
MDYGPDGLITQGDEGKEESTKLLLLKQSEMTTNKEDSGGVHDGNNAGPSKARVLGDSNITNDGSLEGTDGAPGGRGGVGERAFGSKGFGYAARGGRVSVGYTSSSSSFVYYLFRV